VKRTRRVSKQVADFLWSARAKNTVRAYDSDLRHFRDAGGKLPARPQTIARYFTQMSKSFKYSTIIRRRAAISAAHRARGFDDPCASELVRGTLRAVKRVSLYTPQQVQPLLAEEVMSLATRFVPGKGLERTRNRLLLLLGFATALRRSELADLDVHDCGWRRGALVVLIRRSKTDQAALGRSVEVPGAIRGPVGIALRNWLREAQVRDGALFRRISRNGQVLEARVTHGAICAVVKRAVEASGRDSASYGAHSLRAGYVTTAALAGIPLWLIKRQTGHSRETMVESYVRTRANTAVAAGVRLPAFL
jgi:integrase